MLPRDLSPGMAFFHGGHRRPAPLGPAAPLNPAHAASGQPSGLPRSPSGHITRFPDTVTLAAGLRAGRVDVIVEASSTLRLIYEDMDQSAFDRVSGWSKPTDYEGSITFYAAFPFAQGAGELRDEFDAALAGMLESGELQEIAAPYGFGPTDRPGPDSPTLEQLCTG